MNFQLCAQIKAAYGLRRECRRVRQHRHRVAITHAQTASHAYAHTRTHHARVGAHRASSQQANGASAEKTERKCVLPVQQEWLGGCHLHMLYMHMQICIFV